MKLLVTNHYCVHGAPLRLLYSVFILFVFFVYLEWLLFVCCIMYYARGNCLSLIANWHPPSNDHLQLCYHELKRRLFVDGIGIGTLLSPYQYCAELVPWFGCIQFPSHGGHMPSARGPVALCWTAPESTQHSGVSPHHPDHPYIIRMFSHV